MKTIEISQFTSQLPKPIYLSSLDISKKEKIIFSGSSYFPSSGETLRQRGHVNVSHLYFLLSNIGRIICIDLCLGTKGEGRFAKSSLIIPGFFELPLDEEIDFKGELIEAPTISDDKSKYNLDFEISLNEKVHSCIKGVVYFF